MGLLFCLYKIRDAERGESKRTEQVSDRHSVALRQQAWKTRASNTQDHERQDEKLDEILRRLPEDRERIGADPSMLQEQALGLAEDLAGFVDSRRGYYASPESGPVPLMGPFDAHDRETCTIYEQEYLENVRSVRDEALRHGIASADLEAAQELPTTTGQILRAIEGLRDIVMQVEAGIDAATPPEPENEAPQNPASEEEDPGT